MFKNNRKKYLNKIEDNSISIFCSGEAVYKTADQKYPFTVNKNFYYLAGITQQNVKLVMIKTDGNEVTKLFIEKSNPLKEKWEGKLLKREEAAKLAELEVSDVMFLESFDQFIFANSSNARRAQYNNIDKVYLDLELKGPKSSYAPIVEEIKSKYINLTIKDSFEVLCDLRMFKSKEEVDLMREAIKITKTGLDALMSNAKSNTYEYQLESHFVKTLKENNTFESFKTIAASGINATILHYETNDTLMKKDDMILFDLGCEYKQYASDISRTYPLDGKYTDRQKAIYEVVLQANKEVIKMVKPGVTLKELQDKAIEILGQGIVDLGIAKDKNELSKYYMHGVSHHLGLDVHDVSISNKPLAEGCVITVEPGLYIEEESIGIRIEDDILVTKNGYENLSEDIIKEVSDIEKFMSK